MRTLGLLLLCITELNAYSVLSHEAIIDSAWETQLAPLIKKKFPDVDAEDLRKARAYAYGGCIIQDMGYYPFGNHWFSDLVHYVDTGDYVMNLIGEASDANEYAFALGALAHYSADITGHPQATNPSVPLLYPKVRKKFGRSATYEDDPTGHIRTEFAFDVLQVANGLYAPDAYHSFIGFEVAKPLLERAFEKTYGLELKKVFLSEDLAIGTYRRSVSQIIPEMTKVALVTREKQLRTVNPKLSKQQFRYKFSRRQYEIEYGKNYYHPGIRARLLSFLFRVIPKVGPFRAFAFRQPTPEVDKLFLNSMQATMTTYTGYLRELGAGKLKLPNRNLDTGKLSKDGEYHLADKAKQKLEEKTAAKPANASR